MIDIYLPLGFLDMLFGSSVGRLYCVFLMFQGACPRLVWMSSQYTIRQHMHHQVFKLTKKILI